MGRRPGQCLQQNNKKPGHYSGITLFSPVFVFSTLYLRRQKTAARPILNWPCCERRNKKRAALPFKGIIIIAGNPPKHNGTEGAPWAGTKNSACCRRPEVQTKQAPGQGKSLYNTDFLTNYHLIRRGSGRPWQGTSGQTQNNL